MENFFHFKNFYNTENQYIKNIFGKLSNKCTLLKILISTIHATCMKLKKCEAHEHFALVIQVDSTGWEALLPYTGVYYCLHRILDVVGEVAEEVDACPPLQLVDGYHAALQCC